VRCVRCGNENSEDNRFCGMCGASLVAKPQVSGTVAPASPTPAEKRAEPAPLRPSAEARIPRVPVSAGRETAPVAEDRVAPPVDTSPVITGPSFLGLNQPGDRRGAEAHGSHHEHGGGHDLWGRSSRNADYLLEDDEEPKRGWGKLFMVIIALVLAGGFGYLRWKQGGFDWLTNDRKAAPAAESQPNAAGSGTTLAPATPEASNPSPANPANSSPAAPESAAGGAAAAPAGGGATASGPAVSGGDTSPQASIPSSGAPPNTAAAPAQNAPPANASPDGSTKSQADSTQSSEVPAPDADVPANKPKPDVSSKAPVRERKPTPVTPVDPTEEAERFIYGRGVRQDCDRGLRLLKPAAAQSNVKAMISLGALYSTGTCTPRDLPTAYRWFAMALHKQPDNLPLQDDLQKLWSQMTQPERQLAIKLSQ
jgi:hypothetical protein